jgi:glucose-6-phosphate isomerase
MHFASESFEEKLPELLQEINGKEAVVFHCSKSQV